MNVGVWSVGVVHVHMWVWMWCMCTWVCECVRSVGDACEGNSNLKVSSLQLVVYIIIKLVNSSNL